MSAVKIIKKVNSARGIPARVFACLILLCISFSSLPAFAHQSSKSSDLVFCPLQKTWVQKYIPPVKVKEPLGEICASDRQKDSFFFEMSERLPLLRFIQDSEQTEKLFFNYTEKGKRAFAGILPPENLPESQLAKLASTGKIAGNNYKTNFDRDKSEAFVLAQRPRPPTIQNVASFETTTFRELKTISRRIQPRAPPVRS